MTVCGPSRPRDRPSVRSPFRRGNVFRIGASDTIRGSLAAANNLEAGDVVGNLAAGGLLPQSQVAVGEVGKTSWCNVGPHSDTS